MRSILFFILLFVSSGSIAQQYIYDITSNGHGIGELAIKEFKTDSTLQIDVSSSVTVNLFIDMQVKYKLHALYVKDELFYSSVTTYLNGKLHSSTTTERVGAMYQLTKDGHKELIQDKIFFSGALLYIKRPDQMKKSYSEINGNFKNVKRITEDHYQLKGAQILAPDDYFYVDEKLEKAVIHHSLLTFELTKRRHKFE